MIGRPRRVPPWVFLTRDDQHVVKLGDREFPVDPSRPPAYFFPLYLRQRLPTGWLEHEEARPAAERHPFANWLIAFGEFLSAFDQLEDPTSYRRVLTPEATALTIAGTDLYYLDDSRKLQDALLARMIDPIAFQGALYEVSVAATMMRAGFRIEFEDEADSSRKHPEFVATQRRSGTRIAVEAKSIHWQGVMGFKLGNPPPTVQEASGHKIAARVCGQVQRALRKAQGLPMYVFVDLNLPPAVVETHAASIQSELAEILPQVDMGFNDHGVFTGRAMNLLIVTNRPMNLGITGHSEGDHLNIFMNPPAQKCAFPEGSSHINEVKEAVKQYGTIPG